MSEPPVTEAPTFTAFAGVTRLATGTRRDAATAAWRYLDGGGAEALVVFDDGTGKAVDLDLSGSLDAALARLDPPPTGPEQRPGPGRPKLGVVAREVTLLPRHWEWLASQPGGASVALRKLVEAARRQNAGTDRARRRRDAAHSFMWAMAGDLAGFEEASRALFAGDYELLDALVEEWPADVRDHARKLVGALADAERHAGPAPAPADE